MSRWPLSGAHSIPIYFTPLPTLYTPTLHTSPHPIPQIINKPKPLGTKLSDEEKHQKMVGFIDNHEEAIKKFGMLKDYNAR